MLISLRLLIIAFLVVAGSQNKEKPNRIIIYYDNSPDMGSIVFNKSSIWRRKNTFDTLEITDRSFIDRIDKYINKIKYDSLQVPIAMKAIMIFNYSDFKSDTLYTDQFFDYWEINNLRYIDVDRNLYKFLYSFMNAESGL